MTHYAIHFPAAPALDAVEPARWRYLGPADDLVAALERAGQTPAYFEGEGPEVSPELRTVFADNDGLVRSWIAEAPAWMTDEASPERRNGGDWAMLAGEPVPQEIVVLAAELDEDPAGLGYDGMSTAEVVTAMAPPPVEYDAKTGDPIMAPSRADKVGLPPVTAAMVAAAR